MNAKEIISLIFDANSQRSVWERIARKVLAYYDGTGHWTPKEIEKRVKIRRKTALTINLVFKYANLLSGIEKLYRTDIRYVPFENSDVITAEVFNVAMKHIKALNKLPFIDSEVFLSAILLAEAYWEIYYDPFINDIRIRKLSPFNVIVDPASVSYDPNDDAEWVALTWWMPINKALKLFPNYKNLILQNQGVDDLFGIRGLNDFLIDKNKERVKYIQFQKKEWITETLWINPENPLETSKEERIGWVRFDKDRPVIKFYTLIGGELVEGDIKSPYGDMFTVVPYRPVFIEGYSVNLIDQLLDLQDLVNLYVSEAIDNIRQQPQPVIFYRKGALPPEEEKKLDDLQKHKKVGWNNLDYNFVQPPGRIQQPMAVAQTAMALMREIININEVITGNAPGRVDSALGISQLTKNTMASFEMILDNFDRSKVILGKLIANAIKNLYSYGKVIRIMGDEGEELELNFADGSGFLRKIKPETGEEIENKMFDSVEVDMDIIVDKSPESPTTKYLNMAMAQQILQLLPDPRLIIEFIRMSDFPYKDKWIKILQQVPEGAINQQQGQQNQQAQNLVNQIISNEIKQQ